MSRSAVAVGLGERDPPLDPEGQITDQHPAVTTQRSGQRGPGAVAEHGRREGQVLSGREVVVQAQGSAVTTPTLRRACREGGPPNSLDLPRRRRSSPSRIRISAVPAGPVGAQQPDHLTPAQPEVHPVYRREPAEPPADRLALRERHAVVHQCSFPAWEAPGPRTGSRSRARIATVTASCRSGRTGAARLRRERPWLRPAARRASGRRAATTAPRPGRPAARLLLACRRPGMAATNCSANPRPVPGPRRGPARAPRVPPHRDSWWRTPPRRPLRQPGRSATTGRPG